MKSLEKSSLKHIRIVTVSNETKTLCEQMGLNLVEFEEVDQVDWTFDGCDWINRKFQALKTRGGIQTEEKMLAQVSKHYVLLVTKEKLYDHKKTELPICCEILPNSIKVIRKKLLNYNADFNLRISNNMPIKTRHGNYLIDVQWKNSDIPEYISTVLDSLVGIVSHSFFFE
ncbi:hypothetical protein RU90_GL000010 [Lactococcus lactis subsp. hordniae]|uniref:ribose-5-phosphate isomerase n=1 Tax=Lactococcus lactis subsp. hordniae TaxID=203404 RepID=A0A2A5SKZ1_LACLH|nr:hypothetical protein RU90_GL000010 [Lactococcus lactis subsp. hordniae]